MSLSYKIIYLSQGTFYCSTFTFDTFADNTFVRVLKLDFSVFLHCCICIFTKVKYWIILPPLLDNARISRTSLWVRTPRLRPTDLANVTFPLPCPWWQHLKCEGSVQTVFIGYCFSVQDTDKSLQFSSFRLCFFTVSFCCLDHFYNSFQVLISDCFEKVFIHKQLSKMFLYIHVFDNCFLLIL